MSAHILFLYTETPLHAGAGTRVSYIDNPVQRERITNFPIIQASSLKGVLRWEAWQRMKNGKNEKDNEKWTAKMIAIIFGPGEDIKNQLNEELKNEGKEPEQEITSSDFGGSMSITDARVLLFPVRSLKGVFAWLTCPLVLQRLKRDLESVGENWFSDNNVENLLQNWDDETTVYTTSQSMVIFSENNDGKCVFEDFQFDPAQDKKKQLENLSKFLINKLDNSNPLIHTLPQRLVLVHDDVFQEFVEMSTEIVTRIRISPVTGTVEEGALFSEELVPSETVFWTVLKTTDPPQKAKTELNINDINAEKLSGKIKKLTEDGIIQFGGDETLGRGFIRITWLNEPEHNGGES